MDDEVHQPAPPFDDTTTHELDELLRVFCSDTHQQFCADQHVATPAQLQRICQTMQQVQRFIPVIGLAGSPNSDSLRHTLMRTALEITTCFDTICRQRHIRSLTESRIQQLLDSWHEMSRAYDDKSKEHAKLTRLLSDVSQLKKAWRRPDQVESVLASILASYRRQRSSSGMYVAVVDRQNYAQLGLKRKSLGKRHIVFECTRLARDQQIAAVEDVCQRFAAVFEHNAQHNLQQIDCQIKLARPTGLAHQFKQLHACVVDTEQQQQQQQQRHERRRVLSHGAAMGTTTPFRLTSPVTTPSFIWYPRDNDSDDFPIASMPAPSFVPAPWQWADLIKPRTPYHSLFFGFIRRPRRSQPLTEQHQQPQDDEDIDSQQVESSSAQHTATSANDDDVEDAPFATVSVDQLSQHLCRVGYQFYEDVANNAHLSYHQDSRVLQGVGQDLLEIYASLQLESSRLTMHRIMELCQQLGSATPAISSAPQHTIEDRSIATLASQKHVHNQPSTSSTPRPSIASV